MNFTQLALVFLGGGIGASMRWLLSASAVRFLGTAFPAGTFAVNLIGCFLMGLVVEYWTCRLGVSANLRLFLKRCFSVSAAPWRFPCFMRWAPWSWGLAPSWAALH